MIALATYIAVDTWADVHRERESDPLAGVIIIGMLIGLAWFDLKMATIIFGGGI